MKPKNTIEINGRLYDAKTGLPLTPPKSAKKTNPVGASKKFIDGFRPQRNPIATPQKTTAKQATKTTAAASKPARVATP